MSTKDIKNIQFKQKDKYEHLWKYFQLHANQRISLIRYFIVFFTIYITGSGYLLVRFRFEGHIEEIAVIFFSIIFILITIEFKCLDSRNRELIHLAEDSLRKIEENSDLDKHERIFTKEKDFTYKSDSKRHTQCFKSIHNIAIIVAIALILFSLCSCFSDICQILNCLN